MTSETGDPSPNVREPQRIAAFDFDGTLSEKDTLIPFLVQLDGPFRFAGAMGKVGSEAARRNVDLRDRDDVKAALLSVLASGRSAQDLDRRGRLYAKELLTSKLRPDVRARLEEHLRRGDTVVFVSASLAAYLQPLAEQLGVHDVIAVELAEQDGRLTGDLKRPNVRAEQKAVRLREWIASQVPDGRPVELWAYGNSSGDHELMEMADHAFWLGKPTKTPPGAVDFTPERLG